MHGYNNAFVLIVLLNYENQYISLSEVSKIEIAVVLVTEIRFQRMLRPSMAS